MLNKFHLWNFPTVFKVKVVEYKQPLPKTIPETDISYSDHEAVTTKLLIQSQDHENSDRKDSCSFKFEKLNGVSYGDTLAEGIQVLDQILNRLRSDKNIYLVSSEWLYFRFNDQSKWLLFSISQFQVMAFLLIIPLFFLIDIYPPFGMGVFFLIAKMLFCGVIIFLIFMATLWNAIERSGILSAKLSMELEKAALNFQDSRTIFHDKSCS